MKRVALLLTILCLLSGQCQVQTSFAAPLEPSPIFRKASKPKRRKHLSRFRGGLRTRLHSRTVTRIFERRVQNTRQQVIATQRAAFFNDDHVTDIRGLTPAYVKRLNLPPYVRTLEQAKLYLIAQQNRFSAYKSKHIEEKQNLHLQLTLPQLIYDSQHMPRPADPLAFLVKSIPKQVDTILIGEVHEYDSVLALVERFLPLLRQAHPDEEIFLITEFYEQNKEFFLSVPHLLENNRTQNIFIKALLNDIQVVGLDAPEKLLSNVQFEYSSGYKLSLGYSSFGIKWRNEAFIQTIESYRKQHPKAIFIIYTGLGHVRYGAAFSITDKLDPTKTFVIGVLPTLKQVKQRNPTTYLYEDRYKWDPLYNLNINYRFDQPFLYWRNLSRVAGANAYIHAEEKFISIPEK